VIIGLVNWLFVGTDGKSNLIWVVLIGMTASAVGLLLTTLGNYFKWYEAA